MQHYLNYFSGNENTRRAKRAVLRQALAFVEIGDACPTLSHLTHAVLEQFRDDLLAEGLSAATVAQRVSILKHFCKMTAQMFPGWIDPSVGLAAPVPPRRAPEWITAAELQAVRDHVGSEVKQGFLRARALVVTELGFGCGLRRFEISALPLCSLDLKRGVLLNFRRKGGKYCDKPLPRHAREAIERYLPLRSAEVAHYWPGFSKLPEKQRALYPLVVSHWAAWPNKPESWQVSGETINRWLKEFGKAAGIERLHAHRMRHTFCRRLWEHTHDLELVMHGADHSDPKTTMRYVGSTDEQLREAMEEDE